MSFSANFAGRKSEVAEKVSESKSYSYGKALGELTQKYVADVVALAGDDKNVIVETNGHADESPENPQGGGGSVQVNVRIVTVYP